MKGFGSLTICLDVINMAKVLLVEDNTINAKLIRDFLHFNNHSVRVVSSGFDVLDSAIEYEPELILMDIQLFGMSGIDAAKQLKANAKTRDIPIIAVSAFSSDKIESSNSKGLFDDFVEKPIDFTAFEKKIERYLVKQ